MCESEKSARPTLQRVHAQTPSISRGGPERRRRWPPVVSVAPRRSCGLGQYTIFIDMYTSSDLPTSNRAHLARKAPDSADNHPKTPCLPSRTARQGSTAVSGAWHRPGQSVWGRRARVGGGPSPLQLESTGWRLHHPAAASDGGVCQGANTVSLAVRRRLSRPLLQLLLHDQKHNARAPPPLQRPLHAHICHFSRSRPPCLFVA